MSFTRIDLRKSKVDEISCYAFDELRVAINIIRSNDYGFCLILDENSRLKGLICETELRKAWVRGFDYDSPCFEIVNSNFAVVNSGYEGEVLVDSSFNRYEVVPEFSENGDFVAVWMREREFLRKKNIISLIQAGGLGTRLLPLTANKPKPLIEISPNKTLLDQALSTISKCRSVIKTCYVSTRYLSDQIEDYLDEYKGPANFEFKILKEDEPLGTAGSLFALPLDGDGVLMMNADIYSDIDIYSFLSYAVNCDVDVLIAGSREKRIESLGILKFDEDLKFESIAEKPTSYVFASAGIYYFSTGALRQIGAECTASDVPQLLDALRDINLDMRIFPLFEEWYDVGTLAALNRVCELETRRDGL